MASQAWVNIEITWPDVDLSSVSSGSHLRAISQEMRQLPKLQEQGYCILIIRSGDLII